MSDPIIVTEIITPTIDISPIVKKTRKPRMSTIVSKAVLLKQLSAHNLISLPSEPLAVEDKSVEQTIRTVSAGGPSILLPIDEVKQNVPLVLTIEKVELVIERKVDSTETVDVYRCELCDVKFKSKTLYDRHPKTIKHVNNLRNKII